MNLLGYLTKSTQLSPFPWKQSEWQNTEQLGTNQNARSVDKLRARCGSQEANDELKKKLKSMDGPVGLLPFASDFKLLPSEISSKKDIFE